MISLHHVRNLSIDLILDQLKRPGAVLMIGLFLFCAPVYAQQQSRLEKIEFIGLKRVSEPQAISTSGLETGQTIDPRIIDAAAQKLLDSGLFRKLSYRVRATDGQATVIFQVEEANRNLPVLFDNFVWFADTELYIAIRRDVPFFDGTTPESGDTGDKIAAALQQLLAGKKLPGRVEFMLSGGEAGKQALLFSVKGTSIPVCSVHFTGAEAIAEAELVKAAQPLLKTEYSRLDTAQFARFNLYPLYRHLGRLGAKFGDPAAKPEASDACPSGVAIELPVEEGLVYSWNRAEWSGNLALTGEELSAALAMKAGEVADGAKIDASIKGVMKAYARKGYLVPIFRPSFDLDDATQRVTYRFFVHEGPQFRMGSLTIAGLAAFDADRLKEKWKMAPGMVFDQSYVEEFMRTDIYEFMGANLNTRLPNGMNTKIDPGQKLDHQKLTVDITITFK